MSRCAVLDVADPGLGVLVVWVLREKAPNPDLQVLKIRVRQLLLDLEDTLLALKLVGDRLAQFDLHGWGGVRVQLVLRLRHT